MRHGQISRQSAKAVFAVVSIALAAACGDSAVAPTSEVAEFKAPAAFSRSVGLKAFRVGREGATERVGQHIINIPANAICDPLVSSYGAGEWDKPCKPLTRPIVITAVLLEDAEGNPYIDFQPALRFVPTKEVNLYLRSGKSEKARTLNIEYCNNLGVCVDESLTDPSLVTRRVGKSALLVRRIKHFSGYMISSGKVCDGEPTSELDGTLMCSGEGSIGLGRRSGYMVASGLATVSTGPEKPVAKKRYDQ